MAAFDRALYFIVANNGSGANKIISTQTRPAAVRLTGAASSGTWSIDTARLYNASGGAVAIASGTLKAMFSLGAIASSGADYVTTLSFDKALGVANATVMTHFLAGGHVELDITYDTGATATLSIDIRAFKTASFLLNANVGELAHYPGVPAASANIGLASGETLAGNYTFQAADAFNANLAPSGTFSATLTPSGSNGNLAFPSGGSSPADFTQTLLLKVTHSSGASSLLPLDVYVPTDFILLLDQSGSMGATVGSTGTTKWNAAVSASDLFSKLYGDLIQKLTVPGGAAGGSPVKTLAERNNIEIGRFTWDGATAQVTFSGFVSSDNKPTVGSFTPDGGTPIGEGLAKSALQFTADKWRRRHILLLTDGADNAGSPRLNALSSTDLPTTSNATKGCIVHIVSYAQTGDTQVVTLSTFASSHGGQYHDAAADSLDPDALKAMFLSVLADALPVNRAGNLTPRDVPMEEGIERAVFAATRASATTLHLTTGGSGGATATDDTQSGSSEADQFCWSAVDGPAAGTWSAGGTAPAGAQLFALYDLALRMRCGVEQQGLGQPIKLWTELRYRGEPLSGADVRVGTRAPSESLGELLTAFVRQGGIGKALQHGWLSRDVFSSLAERPRLDTQGKADTRSLQRLLLEAAENARNMGFGFSNGGISLSEVAPGRYEGSVSASQTENAHNFYFRADGSSPEGKPFAREHRLSAVLAPEPNQEMSDAALVSAPLAGGRLRYTATVFPRTVLNKPVGPGLAGNYLNFVYLDPADRKTLPALETRDHLDGSYSATFELPEGQKVPAFGLYGGPLAPDAPARGGVVVRPRHGKIRRVKVTLNRIQVLDDHDGIFTGKGELAFDAVVAPNANPHRAVRTRIPEHGVLKLASGEARDLKLVLYEGFVEHDARLAVTIGGTEFDYFLFFMRQERLARYHRVVPLKSAHFEPGDEANDPESLSDWKVWYTVEVE
jgi:hypothetical protein